MPEPVPPSNPPAQPPALAAAGPVVITIQDFRRLELVVGQITEVQDHPKADKLLLLKVDVGGPAPRQLVAGIRGHYAPEQLVGRQVVVAANLAPAVIRGERSEGMVLAASAPGDVPVLLAVERAVPVGSKIR